jgi:hypothetical protein
VPATIYLHPCPARKPATIYVCLCSALCLRQFIFPVLSGSYACGNLSFQLCPGSYTCGDLSFQFCPGFYTCDNLPIHFCQVLTPASTFVHVLTLVTTCLLDLSTHRGDDPFTF